MNFLTIPDIRDAPQENIFENKKLQTVAFAFLNSTAFYDSSDALMLQLKNPETSKSFNYFVVAPKIQCF